jgi:hypothetical protein
MTADRTTYQADPAYWDIAMQAVRLALKTDDTADVAVKTLIHYICNVFGLVTAEDTYLQHVAAERAWLRRALQPEDAHGWELEALGLPASARPSFLMEPKVRPC